MTASRNTSTARRSSLLRANNGLAVAVALASAGLSLSAAYGGTQFINFNFDNGQGLPTVDPFGAASIVPGVGVGGTSALRYNADNDFEIFYNIKAGGAPFTPADGAGVIHLSFHNFIPIGNDPSFFNAAILTYSDANKSIVNGLDNYAPLGVLRSQPTNINRGTYSAWAQLFINQRNIATNVTTGVWRKVDYYVKLFDGTALSGIAGSNGTGDPLPTQGFARIQDEGQLNTLGALPLDGGLVSNYTGVRPNSLTYTQREARALQFFAFADTQLFDNLSIGTLDSTDIDLVLRDVRGQVASRRSDYTGDNLLTAADSNTFINQILDVRYGDSNLDRVVNSADGSTFLANFNNAAARWATGDSTGDDRVDIQDFRLLVRNFGQGSGAWTFAGGGAFATGSNWGNGVSPGGAGATAVFARPEGGVVNLSAAVTAGIVSFGGAGTYELSGPAALTLNSGVAGVPAFAAVTTGAHRVSAQILLASPLVVDVPAGSVLTVGSVRTATGSPTTNGVTVGGGGTLAIRGTYVGGAISIENNGAALGARVYTSFVDLGTSSAIVRGANVGAAAANVASLRDAVRAWYTASGGLPGTVGLGSSDAFYTAAGAFTTIGVYSNAAGGISTFAGQSVGTTDVLVRYTYLGDTDLSGSVDASDLSRVLQGLAGAGTGWNFGDVNYDGLIDTDDLGRVIAALRGQGAPLGDAGGLPGGAIPEPSSLAVLATTSAVLVRRGRERR